MALSTQRAVSDGTLSTLLLSIDYLDRSEISVYFNEVQAADGTWAWVGTSATQINFTPAVPYGVEVLVKRTTDTSAPRNVFANGAQFTSKTLDENTRQALHAAQEMQEGSGISDIYNDVNLHGKRITNMGAAVNAGDALTLGQVMADGTKAGEVYAQLSARYMGTFATAPVAIAVGSLYYDSTKLTLMSWDGARWSAAVGSSLSLAAFSGDGTKLTFTIPAAPADENNTQVYVSGVYQQKDTYSLVGNTLTFSEAPPVGTNNIEVMVISALSIGTTAASATTYAPTDGVDETTVQPILARFGAWIKVAGTTAGAAAIGFVQAGSGAVLRTLQAKLRGMLLDRNDFDTTAAFDAACAATPLVPTLNAVGDFGAKITPNGESTQLALRDAALTVANGPRDAVVYVNSTSVSVGRKYAVMGGFRYRGQYSRGRAPVFPMPASKVATCSPAGLGAETAFRTENWYAAFACANNGAAEASIRTMPFLRVGSVSGSVVTLNKAGEGIHTAQAQTYAWNAANNLAGTECLVISENGNWSGRVTSITANAAGTVTLASVGTLAFGDMLLPAPPGMVHFVYLASFYMDTAEVRNIYDSGTLAKGKMIFISTPDIGSGAFASPGQVMNCAGYISPLATAVTLDSSGTMSTASTGALAEYFDPDGGNHIVQTAYVDKASGAAATYVFSNVQVPFLYYQKFNYYNAGSLAASRVSGQLNITGWIEP